jgi:hypothetical protein
LHFLGSSFAKFLKNPRRFGLRRAVFCVLVLIVNSSGCLLLKQLAEQRSSEWLVLISLRWVTWSAAQNGR